MAPRARMAEPVKAALLAALRAQLAEGEHLAWAESPDPASLLDDEKPRIGKLDAVVIVGGGYATIGAGVMAVRSGQWWWMLVPLTLFLLGAVGYGITRWFKTRKRRTIEGTIYGVTTRRVLIVQTYPALEVQAQPIEAVTDITMSNERDDAADLRLQVASAPADLVFQAITEPARARTQLLKVIRDPKAAEQEIAAAEAYALQMRQLMIRSMPS